MPTVSTQGTEQLKLYKNNKLYNGSRYQFYLTNREQAFQTFLGTPAFTKTVGYKSISEPILLNEFIKDCDELTYGSITNEDKIYYFFVDSITTDAYKQTTITFTIDWWTTNWTKINCTKAHITRQNLSKPGYMEQPISTFNPTITNSSLTSDFSIWATYIPSAEGSTSFISYIILEGNKNNVSNVELGYWVEKLGIAGSDIKDCFIVPLYNYSFFTTTGYYYAVCSANYEGRTGLPNETVKDRIIMAIGHMFHGNYIPDYGDYILDTTTGKYWKVVYEQGSQTALDLEEYSGYPSTDSLMRYITESKATGITNEFKMFNLPKNTTPSRNYTKSLGTVTFTSTELTREGISDWNGNSIWEAPVNAGSFTFTTRLLLGISHIMLEFVPTDNQNNVNMIIGKSFCYDCRHPGLFVDSYKEYVLKNREYDIEMRKIQSEKQELQAWISTAENVGFGAAFGQKAGAAAAGIGGVIEAVGTRVLNELFDPQIQSQYDLRYARMTDQISLVGDSITNVLNAIDNSSGILVKYTITANTSVQTRYNNDINTNGYYSDETTSTLSTTYFATGRVIQADNVVVEGACNVIGKQQVVRRLQNGVEFI